MKYRITWNGLGGELEAVTVDGDEYEGAITEAFIKMLAGNIVSAGDSFTVEEVTDSLVGDEDYNTEEEPA